MLFHPPELRKTTSDSFSLEFKLESFAFSTYFIHVFQERIFSLLQFMKGFSLSDQLEIEMNTSELRLFHFSIRRQMRKKNIEEDYMLKKVSLYVKLKVNKYRGKDLRT